MRATWIGEWTDEQLAALRPGMTVEHNLRGRLTIADGAYDPKTGQVATVGETGLACWMNAHNLDPDSLEMP
jgi:hypothetical protein